MIPQENKLTWHPVSPPPKDGTRVLLLMSDGEIRSGVTAAEWGGFKTGKSLKSGGETIGYGTEKPVLWARYPRFSLTL
jgi:hypothetical protein